MAKQKCAAMALGYSLAILAALHMLVLGILGNLGLYSNAVQAMQNWHLFFSLSVGGVIAGIVEGAVYGFIAGYLIAYFYNKFL